MAEEVEAEESVHVQPYRDPKQPGRLDVNGVEWWACDPYPTWFRWEEGADEPRVDHAKWMPADRRMALRDAQIEVEKVEKVLAKAQERVRIARAELEQDNA